MSIKPYPWVGLRRAVCKPLLAPILMDLRVNLFLAALGSLHLAFTAWGIPFWQCPVKSSLGISCPGCGLSTGMIFLFRGDWESALAAHAFAPLFSAGLPLILVIGFLPGPLRRRAVHGVASLERRTGFAGLWLLTVLVYGMMRIIYP